MGVSKANGDTVVYDGERGRGGASGSSNYLFLITDGVEEK